MTVQGYSALKDSIKNPCINTGVALAVGMQVLGKRKFLSVHQGNPFSCYFEQQCKGNN